MAVNNRTEAIADVDAKIIPTVTNAILRDNLNNDIINSVKFDKDVIGTETPAANAVTVDFLTKDLALITWSGPLAITISNLPDGGEKYIKLTKGATDVTTFVGVTELIDYKKFILTTETTVLYKVTKKNNITYVQAFYKPSFDDRFDSFTSTATSGGTRVLTVASSFQQVMTGTTFHTLKLPLVTGLGLGYSFRVTNKSTGLLTIQTFDADLISYIEAGQTRDFICISTAITTAAGWQVTPGWPNTDADVVYFNEIVTARTNMTAGTLYTAGVTTPVSPYISSGVFTAPSSGVYSFHAILQFQNVEIAATELYMGFVHSASGNFEAVVDPRMFAIAPVNYSMVLSWTVRLAAGDTMSLKYMVTGGASTTDLSATYSKFSGCRVI